MLCGTVTRRRRRTDPRTTIPIPRMGRGLRNNNDGDGERTLIYVSLRFSVGKILCFCENNLNLIDPADSFRPNFTIRNIKETLHYI